MNLHNDTGRRRTGIALAILLTALLAACGSRPPDNTNPTVHITSPAGAHEAASYALTGQAVDNVGVAAITYTLGGGGPQNVTRSGTAFSASVTLAVGENVITVTARDAAGNAASASVAVEHYPPPGSLALSTTAALPGEPVTISGGSFGSNGTVELGGAPAQVTGWLDTQIQLIVPEGAPPGPQELVVHGPHGSTAVDFFVGVDFEGDTLGELAALEVPAGTAIRLGARAYPIGDDEGNYIRLIGKSLYGRGVDQTFIELGAGGWLSSWGDIGEDLVVADLTVSGYRFNFHTYPRSLVPASLAAEPGQPESISRFLQAAQAMQLEPQAIPRGSFTLRDASYVNPGNGEFGSEGTFGDVIMENFQIDAPDVSGGVFSLGSLTMENTTINMGGFTALQLAGRATVRDSVINTHGDLLLVATLGAEVDSSELTASSEEWSFVYVTDRYPAFTPGTGVYGSRMDVRNSVLSGDEVAVLLGPDMVGTVRDNDISAGRVDFGFSAWDGSGALVVENNTITLGADGVNARVTIGGGEDIAITYAGNNVTWLAAGGLRVIGCGACVIEGNTHRGFDSDGTALLLVQGGDYLGYSMAAEVVVRSNVFSSFGNALEFDLDGPAGELYTASINHNRFDFQISEAPQAALVSGAHNAGLNATNNVWGTLTTHQEVHDYVEYEDSDYPAVYLQVNPVTLP